ncbi:MAG: LptF/LptG family permease [Planctomycetia bacterium]|nr:LptF/LptG family permease [Planctomycetia bacterium]
MKILTRYILWETFKIFFVALALSSMGFGLFIIAQATIKMGVPPSIAFRLFPFALPEILSITLPITLLFGATLFCAKMAGSNEIIALKAMGIAPWRALMPLWIFVFLMSLVSVWMNDQALSWGRREMARVVVEGTEATILSKLTKDRKFAVPDGSFAIEVADVEPDGLLIEPYLSSKGSLQGTASTARLFVDFSSDIPSVKIHLTNAQIENEVTNVLLPNEFVYEIPLEKLARSNYRADVPMSQIPQHLQEIEARRTSLHRRMAAKATFALTLGNVREFANGDWVHRQQEEESLDYERSRALLAKPRRWASGFACFFFVWLGAPLAIRLNRSDYFTSFFACFIPILLLYYPIFMFGIEGAKGGNLPPCFAWLANIATGIAGFAILKSIHRH